MLIATRYCTLTLPDSAPPPGTLLAPIEATTDGVGDSGVAVPEVAGASVLSQLPEIIEWLSALEPDKTMVIDSLVYRASTCTANAGRVGREGRRDGVVMRDEKHHNVV